jgi:NhaC family Na+:H+ antiporter
MQFIFSSLVLFVFLIVSVVLGINLLIPLLLGLVIFGWLASNKGFRIKEILQMMLSGTKGIFLIVQILILIGVITSVWMAAGTIPAIGYYGLLWMNPKLFILSAFLLSSAMSFLLGTSFGTAGTIGVVLLFMAKSGGVPAYMAGGAVIAGAFFGDRCSPLSSSANFIAILTETELYSNVKNMFRTAWMPFIMASAMYLVLSIFNPLDQVNQIFLESVLLKYDIGLWAFLPALILLVSAALRIDVKYSMVLSAFAGVLVAVFHQGESFYGVINYILTGYHLQGNEMLSQIMKSGGIVSMINISFIILISAAYLGILDKASLMDEVEGKIKIWIQKIGVFETMLIVSFFASVIGCTQTLAIVIVFQMMKNQEQYMGAGRTNLALDLENSVVFMAPLVPWNIAGAVPAESIGVGNLFIPFAFFLYILPIYHLFKREKTYGIQRNKDVI